MLFSSVLSCQKMYLLIEIYKLVHNFIFDVTASESFTLVHHLASCLIHFTGVPLGYYSHICTTKVSQSLDYFVVSVLFTGLCGTCVTTFTVCCVVVCSLPNWFLHLGKTELRTRYCDCPQFPSLSVSCRLSVQPLLFCFTTSIW